MTRQIQKLTDIAERHEDEIDDLRAMQDFTHEIVFEREQKDSKLKIIIKSWPATASFYDRVRVTDWLLQQAQVQDHTKRTWILHSQQKIHTVTGHSAILHRSGYAATI